MGNTYDIQVEGRLKDILKQAVSHTSTPTLTEEEYQFAVSVLNTEHVKHVQISESHNQDGSIAVTYYGNAHASCPAMAFHHEFGGVKSLCKRDKELELSF